MTGRRPPDSGHAALGGRLLLELRAALWGHRLSNRSTEEYLRSCLPRRDVLRRTCATLFLAALLAPIGMAATAQDVPTALVATVDGPITPVTADHLADGIRTAAERGSDP